VVSRDNHYHAHRYMSVIRTHIDSCTQSMELRLHMFPVAGGGAILVPPLASRLNQRPHTHTHSLSLAGKEETRRTLTGENWDIVEVKRSFWPKDQADKVVCCTEIFTVKQ
jgi:hypothetical protein